MLVRDEEVELEVDTALLLLLVDEVVYVFVESETCRTGTAARVVEGMERSVED